MPISKGQGQGLQGSLRLARHGARACNASSQEAKGRSSAPGQYGLCGKNKVNLNYVQDPAREAMKGGWLAEERLAEPGIA